MEFLTVSRFLECFLLFLCLCSSSAYKVESGKNSTVTSIFSIPGFGIEETYGKIDQISQLLHYRKKDVNGLSRPKRSSCEPSDDLKSKLRQVVDVLKGILETKPDDREKTTTERTMPVLGNPCEGIEDNSHECQKKKMAQILGILLELQAKDELAYLTPVFKETPRTKRSFLYPEEEGQTHRKKRHAQNVQMETKGKSKKFSKIRDENCIKLSNMFLAKQENTTSCCGPKGCCKIHEFGVPFDRSRGDPECCTRANNEIQRLKNLIVSICKNNPNGRCCPYFIKVGILTDSPSSSPNGIQFA